MKKPVAKALPFFALAFVTATSLMTIACKRVNQEAQELSATPQKSVAAVATKEGWGDQYEAALAQAKAEKKLVLLDFTGSDWCGWCIKLDEEVFSKKEFKDYAKENLVLMEVDFPQAKRQTAKLKDQNEKLQGEFGIKGYPTIIVLNSEGRKVGQLGYMEGGPTAFLAELDKLKGK